MAQQASAWSETAASLHTDEGFNSWCGQSTLELSPVTTAEMVGAPPLLLPITVLANTVVTVESVRFLWSVTSQDYKLKRPNRGCTSSLQMIWILNTMDTTFIHSSPLVGATEQTQKLFARLLGCYHCVCYVWCTIAQWLLSFCICLQVK